MVRSVEFCDFYQSKWDQIFAKVQAQSATANVTVFGVEAFKIRASTTLTTPFNFLKDEISGHFFRSSTAIRLGRSTLFATASSFPYYLLTDETRESLKSNLTNLINDCSDPTIEYLQKDAMKSFFSFMDESGTPIERALKPGFDQLNNLENAVKNTDNDTCLSALNINLINLSTAYINFTSAIEACTTKVSASYRVPIRDFVEDNFSAIPVLTAMNFNLAGCRLVPVTEACAKLFLATYSESCPSM